MKKQNTVPQWIVLIFVVNLVCIASISTASITVDSKADFSDINPGDGICKSQDGHCTLRAAIEEAGASDEKTIELAVEGDINLSDSITPVSNLTIIGPGSDVLSLNSDSYPVFYFVAAWISQIDISGIKMVGKNRAIVIPDIDATIVIENCRITGSSKGGIHNEATLFIRNSAIDSNINPESGGGIYNHGTLELTDCILINNSASNGGGGIHNTNYGDLTITRCLFTENNGENKNGGAIYNDNSLHITNSTISGNKAHKGGGIFNCGEAHIDYVTFSDNSCIEAGKSIYSDNWYNGNAFISNTIIYSSKLNGLNCEEALTDEPSFFSMGYNISNDTSCGLSALSDLPNTNPLLQTLYYNGGSTQTHALLSSSPAIDSGQNSNCPEYDQRGTQRPFDGDSNGTIICDIGAYEYKPEDDIDEDNSDDNPSGYNQDHQSENEGAGTDPDSNSEDLTGCYIHSISFNISTYF